MAIKKLSSVHVSWPAPIFNLTVRTNKKFKEHYNIAMMYAHYEMTALDLKKEVVKYLKLKHADSNLLDRIRDMDENRFSTIGKYMYILNHNADIPEDIMINLIPSLEKIVSNEEKSLDKQRKIQEEIENHPDFVKLTPSIQDRVFEKAKEVSGEIEAWIDEFTLNKKTDDPKTIEDFTNLFKSHDLKAPHVRYINTFFNKRITEILELQTTKDKDLIEGYSNFSKIELRKLVLLFTSLLKSIEMVQDIAKIERAPKKKKPVSQDKLVAKLKFKKEDNQLGIVSINPTSIIGAKDVWIYNTKLRKISKLIADEVTGPLSVKGAYITGYDELKSISKGLRKPAEQLAEFKKSTKAQLKNFMTTINSVDIPASGKLNEYCIILRVDK
jgi:hypothetical protein